MQVWTWGVINTCPAVITGLSAVPGVVVVPDTVYCYSKQQCQHHRSYVCVWSRWKVGKGKYCYPAIAQRGQVKNLNALTSWTTAGEDASLLLIFRGEKRWALVHVGLEMDGSHSLLSFLEHKLLCRWQCWSSRWKRRLLFDVSKCIEKALVWKKTKKAIKCSGVGCLHFQ